MGYVGGTTTYEHTRRRAQAVRDLSESQDLKFETIATDFSDEQGSDATRSLLSSSRPPTALIYDSDVMAVAGLGVAAEMGVAVPRDLSIASFDDSVLTHITHPAITSLTRGHLRAR